MSNSVKQISVLQNNGSYVSQPIGADARNVDIDATHTLADKARSWDSKADSSDLDNYVPVTAKGTANGVATLDTEGKIPEEQIPGGIQPTIEIDLVPAQGSENAVSSGGVYDALGSKVDKVEGKGLSANDYTTEEKTKLNGIESGAEVNVIESISVNGVPQTITDKNVDLTIGGGGTYVLPPATDSTLGGVKIGSGLNIAEDGTISDVYEEIPYSTWSAYTDQEKAQHPNAIITGAPDGVGGDFTPAIVYDGTLTESTTIIDANFGNDGYDLISGYVKGDYSREGTYVLPLNTSDGGGHYNAIVHNGSLNINFPTSGWSNLTYHLVVVPKGKMGTIGTITPSVEDPTNVTDKVFEYTDGNTYSDIANQQSIAYTLTDVTKDSFIELRMTCGASDNQMHVIQMMYDIEDATTENYIFGPTAWHQCIITGASNMTGYASVITPIFKSDHPIKVYAKFYYSGTINVGCELAQYSKTATNS